MHTERETEPGTAIPDMLKAALRDGDYGLRSLPIPANEKGPNLKDWWSRATTDPAQLATWFGNGAQVNRGIACGHPLPDGGYLLVVDIDPQHGGEESLVTLIQENGDLPRTYKVRSQGGGAHLYFRCPEPMKGSKPRDGVELKGSGLQVVAPGSSIDGRYYTVQLYAPIADAPDWVLSLSRVAHADALTPERLAALQAPGETPEEQGGRVQEVLDAIAHDARFNDREKVVGMAHRVRDAGGTCNQFVDWGLRYTEGDPYDPEQLETMWETLGETTGTAGFEGLLGLAKLPVPEDHPEHARNRFMADPNLAAPYFPIEGGTADSDSPSHALYIGREGAFGGRMEGEREKRDNGSTTPCILPPVSPESVSEESPLPVSPSEGELEGGRNDLPPAFLTARTLLTADLGTNHWLVDGLIPALGFNLITAKPKVGKSSFARAIAVAVAQGRPILGREITRGPVLYLQFAGEGSSVSAQEHFRALGLLETDPLVHWTGPFTPDLYKQVGQVVSDLHPVLVVVDTIQKLIRVRDLNDYSLVNAGLEPVHQLCADGNLCVLATHHSRKGSNRFTGVEEDPIDSAGGSVALTGAGESNIVLLSEGHQRYLRTVQRDDRRQIHEPTLLMIDSKGWPTLGASRSVARKQTVRDSIVAHLATCASHVPESDIVASVDHKKADVERELRTLCRAGNVERIGQGVRGNPFLYTLARSPLDILADTSQQEDMEVSE